MLIVACALNGSNAVHIKTGYGLSHTQDAFSRRDVVRSYPLFYVMLVVIG